jgi:hypothetical protein
MITLDPAITKKTLPLRSTTIPEPGCASARDASDNVIMAGTSTPSARDAVRMVTIIWLSTGAGKRGERQ